MFAMIGTIEPVKYESSTFESKKYIWLFISELKTNSYHEYMEKKPMLSLLIENKIIFLKLFNTSLVHVCSQIYKQKHYKNTNCRKQVS